VRLSFVALSVALSVEVMACDGSPSPAQPPQRSLETLRGAAPSAVVGDGSLRVEAIAWRSFQPIAGEKGDPMIATVRLIAAPGATVAADVKADAVYFIRRDEVVAATPREEHPRESSANVVEAMVRNGPRWMPGDSIDVVVAVRRGDASTTLIRAPRIVLSRVD
jgi:hypothetical protein